MGSSSNFISKAQLKEVSKRSNAWGMWLTFHVWSVIIGSMAMFIAFPSPVTFILAFLLIGSRQHGLAILMHDAAHGVLFRNRTLNEFVGKWLLGAPYGGDLASYRKYHLKHHRYAQRENDPDLPLSAKFPTSKASLKRKFTRDLTGQTYLRLRLANYRMKRGKAPGIEGSDAFQKTSPLPYLITNIALFLGMTLAGYWWLYPTLWLAPLFTWFFFVLRLRNIAEHGMTTNDDNPLTHARTTKINWLERIFFGPYWVTYHVEHHAYMFVPCYRLKVLHDAMKPHHRDMNIQQGYKAILKLAIS